MQKEKLLKEIRALLELCDERGLKLVKQLIIGILQISVAGLWRWR